MPKNNTSTGKGNFFISKKEPKAHEKSSQSSSSSGNFFITASEKNKVSGEGPTKRHNTPIKKSTKSKKPFDKKQWRMKKYSKKYKLEEWENKRKKHVLEGYYKEIKDEVSKFDVKKIYEKYGDEEGENDNNLNQDMSLQNSSNVVESRAESTEISSRGKKTKAYKKAKSEFQRIQEEKKRKREEIIAKKSKREEALKQYKAKKLEKYKKLNQKTKKGQPIMKHRMQMLLEQIQKSMS
ncbi:hypothetical protein RI129_002249 [Pyrocoelia pectoralis]|uniref:Thyroid transcription factor 1-associated protein 26 n=1 Tax=Pyrocoelia pectoralis TaxID=417401 RepID=A0AAN7ZKW6_9COLE